MSRLEAFLDREELFDLVRRERFARDQRLFDVMRACFHDDAYVRTTWYDGRGGDAYVAATQKWMSVTSGGKHWVFPAYAKINGDRATVESPSKIFGRGQLNGVEIDYHTYCRFFSRAVRQDGVWKILSFHVLFERDELRPVIPGEALNIDKVLLASLRPSYRFISLMQAARGVKVNQELLGDDRPEQLAAFHAGEDVWLAGAD